MNAVEIEEAVSTLASAPFDPAEFPYAFLEAFGNKETTLRKLRSGASNLSDLPGGVLQRNHLHLQVCPPGEVSAALAALRASPRTTSAKAKFILVTDGLTLEAEHLADDTAPPLVCPFPDFADHFGFFLPLAGISTVRQIAENAFDIKATGRLNRLYVELLKDNPDWSAAARREDLNHFFARLIFCFFAEDTGIFHGTRLFSSTIEQMTQGAAHITHEVISEIFRAMNVPVRHDGQLDHRHRAAARIKPWADAFPYVNGGLFSDRVDVPRFTGIARAYLLKIGQLDWTKINPDIFGSMIQAVADDAERGALGMHYTSVPNILKVLNPLFLDELRARLAEAGDGKTPGSLRKLQNLRSRLARIRVFDPACGSGNFLVIAYKELRAIEAAINRLRGEADRPTELPLTNFRGIELRHFSCEIARLALIIAEYQCDAHYRGDRLALAEFLPLQKANWITCGNALRIDWLSVCPPTGKAVKIRGDELFDLGTPASSPAFSGKADGDVGAPGADQAEIDFKNEGGETYICGNPPYLGSRWRDSSQQRDLADIFSPRTSNFKDLDYVAAWYLKASEYIKAVSDSQCAFVATKSICQGEQVAMLWTLIYEDGLTISFAHRPFHWSNLASHNAGVTVVIVGLSRDSGRQKTIYEGDERRIVPNIGPYLTSSPNVIVSKSSRPINGLPRMDYGNKPTDGGHLLLDEDERNNLLSVHPTANVFIKNYIGSNEFIKGLRRYCVWVEPDQKERAYAVPELAHRFEKVRQLRRASSGSQANANAATPHRFVFAPHTTGIALIVPRVSSERRPYLPAGLLDDRTVVSDRGAVIYNPETWVLAVVVSRMHLVWIANVCVRMRMDFSYSNTLGWNTFPVPPLTDQNKADLTRCAEAILLAREAHFPATIAELYAPGNAGVPAGTPKKADEDVGAPGMPANLRAAHERNDETLERIYLGRRFKNDTERLEKLFALYTEMTANHGATKTTVTRRGGKPPHSLESPALSLKNEDK